MGDPARAPVSRMRLSPRVIVALAAAGAGSVLLFVGWWGVSGESLVALQLPYLASASIPGAALVIAAAVLLSGRHASPATDARVETLFALLTEPVPSTDTRPDDSRPDSVTPDDPAQGRPGADDATP